MEKLVKRTWCFIQTPNEHGIVCPRCNSINLAWSEWAKHIWCYDCEEDINDYDNPLSGPVPIELAGMLGISANEVNLETGQMKIYNFKKAEFEIKEPIVK